MHERDLGVCAMEYPPVILRPAAALSTLQERPDRFLHVHQPTLGKEKDLVESRGWEDCAAPTLNHRVVGQLTIGVNKDDDLKLPCIGSDAGQDGCLRSRG